MRLKLMAMLVGLALNRGLRLGALAATLDKDGFSKLDKSLQGFYKANGDSYALDVEGGEDVGGLKSALDKEKTTNKGHSKQIKDLQERLTAFDGLDAEAVRELLKKVDGDEEGKLLKEGKLDVVIQRRMAKANEAHETERKKWDTERTSHQEAQSRLEQLIIDQAVTQAGLKSGAHAAGIEDALLRARPLFRVNAEKQVVQLDGDGKPILGKDGKTPVTPTEWIESMKETAPHWFTINGSGGGAGGSREKGSKRVVKRSEFNAMNPGDRAKTARDTNVQIVD